MVYAEGGVGLPVVFGVRRSRKPYRFHSVEANRLTDSTESICPSLLAVTVAVVSAFNSYILTLSRLQLEFERMGESFEAISSQDNVVNGCFYTC